MTNLTVRSMGGWDQIRMRVSDPAVRNILKFIYSFIFLNGINLYISIGGDLKKIFFFVVFYSHSNISK